jgi:nitrate reductase (NAD(P)H)
LLTLLHTRRPAQLKVWYVVSKVARPEDGWAYGVGRVLLRI